MSKAFSINIRVTKQQKEVIEKNAQANGYNNLSDYIRARGLCFLACEEKLTQIYKKIFTDSNCNLKITGADRKLAEFI